MLTLNGKLLKKAKSRPYARLKISLVIATSYVEEYPYYEISCQRPGK
jgi:hypothetical protein